jgi:hypothetical protein
MLQLNKLSLCFTVLLALVSDIANALPAFARQTEQSCVACHAGGQFPELTPYGRMFKLTGYTMGQQTNPFAVMLLADSARIKKNQDASGNAVTQKDGKWLVDQASIFVAGKITNNVGLFSQFTYTPYDYTDTNGNIKGHAGSDEFDLRYAGRSLISNNDAVWGFTIHNTITAQDVWNSSAAWGYPYVLRSGGALGTPMDLPVSSILDGGLGPVAGTGMYTYINKNLYLELTGYSTAKSVFSVMSLGSHSTNQYGYIIPYISGIAPYARIAYTHEIGASNFMLGASYLDLKQYPNDGIATTFDAGLIHYKDYAVDGQYQYLLSPYTVTATFRYTHETIHDDSGFLGLSGPAKIDSFRAKLGYVYESKYGASISYATMKGSADASYDQGASNLYPNSTLWTPEIFWIPQQNIRVGLQYRYFTRYYGASSNYDGNGRNAKDNNSTFMYMWFAY